MRKLSLASAIAAACLFTAGVASAADVNDQVLLELDVAATCAIKAQDAVVSAATGDFSDRGGFLGADTSAVIQSQVSIACNQDLPYTIETNADANGMFTLTGQSTGTTVQAKMVRDEDELAWGSLANAEQYSGVGDGRNQFIGYTVHFNVNDAGFAQGMPANDVYSAVASFTATS